LDRTKLEHSASDSWTWRTADHADVESILDLVAANYELEIDGILTGSRPRMAYHLHKAIMAQIFEPHTNLVTVAVDKQSNRVIAWAWLERGKFTPYAPEEMAVAEFLHMELALPTKTKIKLVAQTLMFWEDWAFHMQIPVLCSTSIRADQAGFMRLHEQLGFTVRGSIAYKRIL